ncbi:hypothetical protein GIY23_11400 [Allosaccharopolyspora coralli]|uniref:Uncharacterized protein n=1 Tax=Allosaccharopolyspora coralli TaxID=2665642 RepID=A0A5Q3Q6T9_9PSEU|nr:hypothetical protein [Allosaccharopolyspora coralli]QGK70043.1 hypothetical protein GIY23_11400 [Allosaccharopolyspora coralli]
MHKRRGEETAVPSRDLDSVSTVSPLSPVATRHSPVRAPRHLDPAPDSPLVPAQTALGDDVGEEHLIRGYD